MNYVWTKSHILIFENTTGDKTIAVKTKTKVRGLTNLKLHNHPADREECELVNIIYRSVSIVLITCDVLMVIDILNGNEDYNIVSRIVPPA